MSPTSKLCTSLLSYCRDSNPGVLFNEEMEKHNDAKLQSLLGTVTSWNVLNWSDVDTQKGTIEYSALNMKSILR